ncbi:protein of unknown function [endosymbiont DhMRE of Dentiscutata heterogama]|uniref:hypothetical protein n=1 Tax=endosymbiont DhMRE of Dentiscutata heterogama TaxID=1609546 RepID=UPI000629D2C4|nr:hypothetical protein [endosymbiont DhMRE of Dentiscutata heterogama]CFW93492.1 protein of unknown function [endosymbiont DhMRE of Dentiscutata heterogama]
MNKENLNKKIEETQKKFEKMFGGNCSYHEEDSWNGGKNGIFTIKFRKNIEILNGLERAIKKNAGERPVIFEIKGRDGKLTKVSKEEFAKWMVNEKNNDNWVGGVFSVGDKEQIEKPKESLVYGGKWNIEGTTYYTERKGQDGVFREDYWKSRSEEEKNQIIERNRQKREAEKSQSEVSTNQNKEVGDINLNEINQRTASDKKDQTDEEVQQQNIAQKTDNKDNNKNIYYGIGAISLVLLVISMVVVWVKKR